MRRFLVRLLAAAGFILAASAVSHAQCTNNNINQAFQTVLKRAPRGSGTSGECNPNNYGGGSWTDQMDLQKRVGAGSYCANPWIGQIYYYVYNRYPTNAECNISLYGTYTTYMGLASNIEAYQQRQHAIAPNATKYVPPNPGPSVTSGIPSTSGANVVAAGGGNFHTLSVNNPKAPAGEYLVAPNMALVDQNGTVVRGAGTYKLIVRSGSYVLSASGTTAPKAGMIVLPK